MTGAWSGMAGVLTSARGIVAAGKAVTGPIISLTNTQPYARPIETGIRSGRPWRKAGGAFMYKRGIDATRPMIGPALTQAIPQGAAGVQRAKAYLNNKAAVNVQQYTPVRSGALRAGVQPVSRPG